MLCTMRSLGSSPRACTRQPLAAGRAIARRTAAVKPLRASHDEPSRAVTPFGHLTQSLSAAFIAATLLVAPISLLDAPPALADESEVSRKAVDEYSDLESKGKTKSSKALDDFRAKYRIKRTVDGRVQLKSTKGEWWSVRLDMEVRGPPMPPACAPCPHARSPCCVSP